LFAVNASARQAVQLERLLSRKKLTQPSRNPRTKDQYEEATCQEGVDSDHQKDEIAYEGQAHD
jgi:hypothetical protein